MVEGYTYETENSRGLKAKERCKEGLTGMLLVDPVARIDLGRRIRIGRLRLAAALQRGHRRGARRRDRQRASVSGFRTRIKTRLGPRCGARRGKLNQCIHAG
jgi:hypothetical protein